MRLPSFDAIWNLLMALLQPYSRTPNSTYLVLGIALVLAILNATATRLLVDMKKVKHAMNEYKAWRKEFAKAKASNDKNLLAKTVKRQQAVMQLQSKASLERMKVTFLFILPFWVVWIVLSGFFGETNVAFSPFAIPLAGEQLHFFSWYLISSFGVSLPITKFFGVNPED